MGTLQADIQENQREIEKHHRDLFALYMELATSIASIEEHASIGYAQEQYKQYTIALQKWEQAKDAYAQVHHYIEQMQDRSRKVKEITADIKALDRPKRDLFAKFGVIAYEAYGSPLLSPESKETCKPFFEEHHKKTKYLEERLEKHVGLMGKEVLKLKITSARSKLLPLLVKAGRALCEKGYEKDLPLTQHPQLSQQLNELRVKEASLQEELQLHQGAIARLRSEEVPSTKVRLDQYAQAMKREEKSYQQATYNYGKTLYTTLPDSVHSDLVGQNAISLMDQITLHRSRIRKLEQDIQNLQNMIKVQELEAQIELENQKIDHLHTQIETCNHQIDQVQSSIARKRAQIATLMPEQEVGEDG